MKIFLVYFFLLLPSFVLAENQSEQALGIACLHCKSPKAKEQSIQIAEILRDSGRRNIATSVLMDNSFGESFENIENIIKISTSNGSKLNLYLYYGNGPWQRKSKPASTLGFGTNLKPKDFRFQIINNINLQNKFKKIVASSKNLLILNSSLGGSNFIIPMLEDNLDQKSARFLEKLTKEVLGEDNTFSYKIGRNPCPKCFPNNDNFISEDSFMDQHINSYGDIVSVENGLVTNDGIDFYFPNQKPETNKLSIDNLKKFILDARAKNNSFIIWSARAQGISNTKNILNPDRRKFKFFSANEASVLKEILCNY